MHGIDSLRLRPGLRPLTFHAVRRFLRCTGPGSLFRAKENRDDFSLGLPVFFDRPGYVDASEYESSCVPAGFPPFHASFSCCAGKRLATLPSLYVSEREGLFMPSFPGVDFIDFDSQLNDEEKLVRQTARQFVDNEIIPIIEKHSREGTFPKHLIPQLGELGFFGANLHGYGCAGMSNVAYGLMTQELERGDSGLRSFVSVQGALVMYPIYSYGSDAQKNKWLPL